jgi:TRAP-type transport system periplasmic protein
MKNKTLFILLALLLVVSLVLIGCQGTTTTSKTTAPASSTAQPSTSTAASTTATTPQNFKLKFGASLPEFHAHSLADINWMKKIEEETQGRVTFEPYWGGTLTGADPYTDVQAGVADVAWFSRISTPAGYDMGIFIESAFVLVPLDSAQDIVEELLPQFPEIMKEYAAVKPLSNMGILGDYNVFTVNKAIRKADDFKGLTIDCPGAYAGAVSNLGGSPTSLGPPDWYTALQKSTIDGIVLFGEAIVGMKFADVIKYITVLNYGDGPEINRGMNLATWNKLPADIQAVFERNKEYYTYQVKYQFAKANAGGYDAAKVKGIEFITLPADEKAKLDAIIVKVQDEQAAKLDAKGLPGTKMMKEIRRLTAAYTK